MCDASEQNHPIVYVNSAFERITGYAASAVLGRNCRFLQGEATSEQDRAKIRAALAAAEEILIDIDNYRANGERFRNRLVITPLRDDANEVTHFLGIQTEIDGVGESDERVRQLDESLREVQHRVKNHLSMLLALIRLEASQTKDAKASLQVLGNRVEALNLLYSEFSGVGFGNSENVGLGAYISRVCSALNMLDGQRDVVVNIEAESFQASVEMASQVGLLLSELLTNALQHAFGEEQQGVVEVASWQDDSGHLLLRVKDDGCGLSEDSKWPYEGNLGARIVRDIIARLDADLKVESSPNGTTVLVSIPQEAD